jgi:mevalonate kinase
MQSAVDLALKALTNENFKQLQDSIDLGLSCFQDWGLVSDKALSLGQELIHAGALAFKPTGSGGGGYIIALWEKSPPEKWGKIIY